MNVWSRILRIARKWTGWTLLGLAATAIIYWFTKVEVMPQTIRIATAPESSLYHQVGSELADLIRETGVNVEVLVTEGTVENVALLQEGNAEIALLQSGAAPMQEIYAIAPLYPEPVHVIARKSSNISSLEQLAEGRIAVGMPDSGMRKDAVRLLEHLGNDSAVLVETDDWYATLIEDETVDGAIITTGMLHPDLEALMKSGEFEPLPVLDAQSITVRQFGYRPFDIPRGMYCGYPAQPAESLPTITTTAFIAVPKKVPTPLVELILKVIYEDRPIDSVPRFFSPEESKDWQTIRLHPAVQSYHEPYKDMGLIANFMESLSAVKELLFALAAGMYLLWARLTSLRKRKAQELLEEQREKLDALLEETLSIERAQMDTCDLGELEALLDDVTRIKLRALDELTHQELRANNVFSIFLMQCANLIRKIQGKIIQVERR